MPTSKIPRQYSNGTVIPATKSELSVRKQYQINSIEESTLDVISHAMKLLHQRQACAIMYNKGEKGYLAKIRAINQQIKDLLNLNI